MNVGQALHDTSTALGRAHAQLNAEREQRIARAREMVANEGISLEEALDRIWADGVVAMREP